MKYNNTKKIGNKMGIRVHKILGYALLDVKTKKHQFADSRFTKEFVKSADYGFEEKTQEKFIEFLKPKDHFEAKMVRHYLENNKKWYAFDFIHYALECGSKKVVLFMEPTSKDWRRHDDIIDYYQENCQPKTKVKRLSSIYPYIARYTDLRTGKTFNNNDPEHYAAHFIAQYIGGFKWSLTEVEEKLKELDLKSLEEFKEKIVNSVPESIRLFCQFLNVFNDPMTVHYLKPILYTYWS